jgi:hypothetical protein
MKLLITTDTFAPSLDGAAHLPANTFAEVETDTGHALVAAGKALYVDPKDDRSRIKVATAAQARIDAVVAALKAAEKAAKG